MLRKTLMTLSLCARVGTLHGQAVDPPQLIRNVRVFDGERIVQHRSVLIERGKIARIGGATLRVHGASIIDGRNRTLLPGLIDAHVHLAGDLAQSLHQALALGVTTELDMFSSGERLAQLKKLEAEDGAGLADLRTAGTGATAPGGHPTQMGGPPIPTIDDAAQAQAFVDARIAEGADYIKIIHDDGSTWTWTDKRVPMLDNATMRALIETAHRRGKLAVVHALSESQARDAIEAGADGLVHLFSGDTVSPDFGTYAGRHGVFVITTLSANYAVCGRSRSAALAGDARLRPWIGAIWLAALERAKPDVSLQHFCSATDDALRQLVRAHVPVLAGTDAPAPGTAYGASLHGELELLVRAGLSPVAALTAATSAPARAFHLDDRGAIRAGLRADLLLVDGDPATRITDTRNIVAIWKRGVRVER